MTSKEALEKIDWVFHKLADALGINFSELVGNYKFSDEMEKIIELVERDTPMKPIIFKYEEHRLNQIECKNGCKPFKDKDYKFCPHCGQRLDWSGE